MAYMQNHLLSNTLEMFISCSKMFVFSFLICFCSFYFCGIKQTTKEAARFKLLLLFFHSNSFRGFSVLISEKNTPNNYKWIFDDLVKNE